MPELRRSPGGEYSNPLQYSCLENPMDRGTCQSMESQKSQTWLKPLIKHGNWKSDLPSSSGLTALVFIYLLFFFFFLAWAAVVPFLSDYYNLFFSKIVGFFLLLLSWMVIEVSVLFCQWIYNYHEVLYLMCVPYKHRK